jgi:hypothetical protein
VTDAVRTCPSCRLATAKEARFCPNCGASLEGDAEAVPAPAAGEIAYTQPPPHLFGVLAPTPTFVLATILLAGALVALFAQSWVLGVMLLAFSAALYVLFYGAAERDPSSGVAKTALSVVGRILGWTRFATGSAGAWSGAGRRLYDIRRELGPLRRERREVLAALGDAAYRQDEGTIASLRARIAEIDDAIAEREREREETMANARKRVEDERLEASQTQFMPPDDPQEAPADAPR